MVEVPGGYYPERDYILSVMLSEFLGFDLLIRQAERTDVSISFDNDRFVTVEDVLFGTPSKEWLTMGSLPERPLKVWDSRECLPEIGRAAPGLPLIYGSTRTRTQPPTPANSIHLPIDLFGSSFFMLTRYEEAVVPDRDGHGRFPASAALSVQEGFFERPIVNEYLEVLWAALSRLWPGIVRKKRQYRLVLSHDVDRLFHIVGQPFLTVIKRIAGDIIKRRDLGLALRSTATALPVGSEIAKDDPYNTFDFIMDAGERYGIKSTFNFMPRLGDTKYDRRYDIAHPGVRPFLRLVSERGHFIGLHTTYGTLRAPALTLSEFERLTRIAGEEGIFQTEWGGRQHYLRWENPTTWQSWEDAGLNYDSTLGFAETAGFRSGCCYDYPVYNLKTRRRLNLREKPLVAMEAGEAKQEEWTTEKSLSRIARLAAECRRFDGDFTLLWHNSSLATRWQKEAYQETLKACSSPRPAA